MDQGTVLAFDPDDGRGSIIKDDGSSISFPASAFAASGLRLLRPGQRVKFRLDAHGAVELVTILTLEPPG